MAEKYEGHGTHLLGNSPTEKVLVEECCKVAGEFDSDVFNLFCQIVVYPFGGHATYEKFLVEECYKVAGEFNSHVFNLFRQIVVYPFGGHPTNEVTVEYCIAKLNESLNHFEKKLSQSKYLAGECFTVADLQHFPWTHYLLTVCKKGDLLWSPRYVSRWWEDISSHPAWKKVVQNMKQGKGAGTPVAGFFLEHPEAEAEAAGARKVVAVEIEEGEASARREGVSRGAPVEHESS